MNLRQKMKAAHDAQLATAAAEAKVDVTGLKLIALATLELPYKARATNTIFTSRDNTEGVNKISEWLSGDDLRRIAEHSDNFFFADDDGNFGFFGQIRHAADGAVTGALYLASN